MPGGLSFLSKKRFHPGRLDQQERVWLKETGESHRKEMELAREEEVKFDPAISIHLSVT